MLEAPLLGDPPRELPLLLRAIPGERRPLLRMVGELSPACAGELGVLLEAGELGGNPLGAGEVGSPLGAGEVGSPLGAGELGSPLGAGEVGSALGAGEVGNPLEGVLVGVEEASGAALMGEAEVRVRVSRVLSW